MSEWIKVEDRLPECNLKKDSFGVSVLVWPHNFDEIGKSTVEYPVAYFGCRITKKPSFYLHGLTLHHISHWMPLPEPPKDWP